MDAAERPTQAAEAGDVPVVARLPAEGAAVDAPNSPTGDGATTPETGTPPPLEIVSLALGLLAWIEARFDRQGPPLGTREAPPAAVLRHRTARPHRPRHWLRLPARWPRADGITHAINRLHALPSPS